MLLNISSIFVFMIKSYTLSLMSVCLDQRKMALFQNYLLEYLQILA
jgi:uncharacterized membrane protein YqjE